MGLATFGAASAEGALSGIVAPLVLGLGAAKLDGARSAMKRAHRTSGAAGLVEFHEPPITFCHRRPRGIEHSEGVPDPVSHQHGQNVHRRILRKSADEIDRKSTR